MNSSSSSFHLVIFATAFIFLRCLCPTGAATCHPDDEAGLLAFKSGITRDPSGVLSSWKKGTDCCSSWRGVLCSDSKRVNSLAINGQPEDAFILSGTISPLLAKLQHLEVFDLANLKNITGPFPHFLFRLPNLYSINIENNRLSGPLPVSIKEMSKLSVFIVEGNRFTGPIPSSISKLPSLTVLNLAGNLLTGTIPLGIANLKHMAILDLSGNHLSGTIPNIFKSMTELYSLVLSRNKFSGELSPLIASLPPRLMTLMLGQNKLSGSIPTNISRFKELDTLDLSRNQLSGVVPQLTRISHIDLSHNLLTGPFPVLSVETTHLDLSYNQFTFKTIPRWLNSVPGTYSLKLAKCGIKMRLDDWKPEQTTQYVVIDLSENQISGSPARFFKENFLLQSFQASGNKLRFDTGKLNFSNTLKTLDLSRNLVFGKVPSVVARLKTLNLSQNHLCGKLPVTKFPPSAFAGNHCLCGSPLAKCKV